ncbi:MAG: hypothetical protein ACK52J_02975 [bacterium]
MCRAAIHDGKIKDEGGEALLKLVRNI